MPDDYNAIADRAFPAFRRSMLSILTRYREGLPLADIEALVAGGYGVRSYMDRLSLRHDENLEELRERLSSVFLKSMNAEAKRLAPSLKFADAFATINEEAVLFLQRYSGLLLDSLEASVRETVRDILIRGQREGTPVRLQAKAIADAIGLTPRQSISVLNIQNTAYQAAIDAGKTIGQAEAIAAKASAAASKRALLYRATNIARTETLRAANFGQLAVWEQYQREGLLPANATKVWIVTPDDRLCVKICRPMDGVEALVTGDFETPAGAMRMPPAHASCRCAAAIGRA